MAFLEKISLAAKSKRSCIVVGLDPHLSLLPASFGEGAARGSAAAATQVQLFLCRVIDATCGVAVGVKLQSAFFEVLGAAGIEAFAGVAEYANRAGLVVIGDVKRGDIGSTAEAYAAAYLGSSDPTAEPTSPPFALDAITVNPYLGEEGLLPFVDACARNGKGLFVLVRTSNPSSDTIQNQRVGGESGPPLFEVVARMVQKMGEERFKTGEYQPIGAVAGATYPADLRRVRELLPRSILLVPGYGAQGATAADLKMAFDSSGFGALVNASRSITFAYRSAPDNTDPFEAAYSAAERMRQEIAAALSS